MKMNQRYIGLIGVLILVLGAALFFVFRGQGTADPAIVVEPQSELNVSSDQVENTEVPVVEEATAAPTEESMADSTQLPPTPKQGLVATDPGTVVLATGELQLIEAFAFW